LRSIPLDRRRSRPLTHADSQTFITTLDGCSCSERWS
jgi:hypothetical protein